MPAPTTPGGSAAALAAARQNARQMSLRQAFFVFGNPYFRWLWGSTAASFVGMQMQLIARGVLAWQLTHSYAMVGVVEASFAIPMALFALPGGAAVDRVEKRQIVMFSQGVMGILGLVTGVLIQTDVITVAILFGVGVIQGALFSFNGPARMALLTELVEERELTAAIALQNIAMNSTRIVGPAAAAVMIATVNIQGAYYLNGLLYLFTVVAMSRIPRTTGHIGVIRQTLPREIGAGLRHVFGNHTLRSLMLSGFALVFFVMPYMILLPGFADQIGRPAVYGLMMTTTGIGGLIGSFGIAALSEHPRKPLLQLIIGVGAGISLIALGLLTRPFGIAGALLALGCLGAASTSYMTLNQTMLMSESSREYHGRVMSIFMQTFSAMPLMALPLGVLADRIGALNLFVMQGVVVTVVITALALSNRRHTFRVHAYGDVGDPVGDDDVALAAGAGRRATPAGVRGEDTAGS